MKYHIKPLTIKQLLDLLEKDRLDLKPYYQRNDIWSRKDQEMLIDSIIKGYPLPSFFIYERQPEQFEMVDGQQRTRTILRFVNNEITSSEKIPFKEFSAVEILDYVLSVTQISDVQNDTEIEQFYTLVNKRGKHLTTPELHKAEFAQTRFLELVERLLEYQNFMNLNLFSDSASKRMNDRNFIEELAAYLIYGIQDKKKIIENIYKNDIDTEDYQSVEIQFQSVIDKIFLLNEHHLISKTRFRQKNDFYTLFNFTHKHLDQSDQLREKQYNFLLGIEKYISPSIEDCKPLREYALNCVSQSNSKGAREKRLQFLESILLNKEEDISKNPVLTEVLNFIHSRDLFGFDLVNIDGFILPKLY